MQHSDIEKMAQGYPPSKIGKDHEEVIVELAKRMLSMQQKLDAVLAELAEPVLYALRFKNSRGQPEELINENCLFRDKKKAAAYGLGGKYVTQESGKIEWVPNTALNPEVIPLFTRPAPAINLADLVPSRKSAEDYVDDKFSNSDLAAIWNSCVSEMLRNIERQPK